MHMILPLLVTLVISFGHAFARPLKNEYRIVQQMAKMRLNKPTVVQSDGFEDEEEEQEHEVTFSEVNVSQEIPGLRNRVKHHAG
ncbi:hypothetical protein ACHAWF_003514 [Thalassiosira exigua]